MSATPRGRIEAACSRLGQPDVVARCLGVLAGAGEDAEFLVTLGGDHAVRLLEDGVPSAQRYWLRVWAARGLLWAGPGRDHEALRAALADEAWRVREMTCKVVARHVVGDLLETVAAMESDPVVRVRRAAERATRRIIEEQA